MVLSGEGRNCLSSPIRQHYLQPEFTADQTSPPRLLLKPENTARLKTITPIDSLPSAPSSLEPPTTLRLGSPYTVSPTPNNTPTNVARPEPLTPARLVKDDTAVQIRPWRNVDYLSYSWKEEDILSSWKYIRSERDTHDNSARLENACWRAWAKSKDKLNTVSPESLNWLKDYNITWLYGPLQTSPDRPLRMPSFSAGKSSHISKFNSFLLKQAAAGVQAHQCHEARQRGDQIGTEQAISDRVIFPFSLRRMSTGNPSLLVSDLCSGLPSPSTGEEKHIHFNEQVAQCIALEMTDDKDEEVGSYTTLDDSDLDDGVMMKSMSKLPSTGRSKVSPRTGIGDDSKMIGILPPTTLKHKEGIPEPPKTAAKHSNGWWNGRELCIAPPQNPLSSSSRISLESWEDDDTDTDMDTDWQPPRLNSDASGIFIPYEDEEGVAAEGLFRRAVNMANTAKDIAYLMWNTSLSRQSWKEGEDLRVRDSVDRPFNDLNMGQTESRLG